MKVWPDLGKGTGAAMKFFTQIFYARENFGATVLAKISNKQVLQQQFAESCSLV